MYLLRKGAYKDFFHIILKHAGIKGICTEEKEKSYDSSNICSNFGQISVISVTKQIIIIRKDKKACIEKLIR